MKALLFYAVRFVWLLLSILPFWALYILSDFLYFLVYYVVGYRRKVVRKNLVNAFPKMTMKEIAAIEKKNYRALCDYFIETIKLDGMSEKELRKHIDFTGTEKVQAAINGGQSVVAYMAHTFNWEYATSMPLFVSHENLIVGQIYHPLRNKHFDELLKKIRGQYGSENIAMKATLRRIVDITKQQKQFLIGFIADQIPKWEAMHHWVTFMNQDTAVFTGTEKIARRTGSAVFFLSLKRVNRGKYVGHFAPMADNAAALPELELTNMYYKMLEDSIKEAPELWLWTHNRWKRTRQGQEQREKRRVEERRMLADKNHSQE